MNVTIHKDLKSMWTLSEVPRAHLRVCRVFNQAWYCTIDEPIPNELRVQLTRLTRNDPRLQLADSTLVGAIKAADDSLWSLL